MTWEVVFTSKAAKQRERLPAKVKSVMDRLVIDLRFAGPIQFGWHNYSKLGKHEHHCHLSYRWVACWRETDTKDLELIEIYYAGSRENAPY